MQGGALGCGAGAARAGHVHPPMAAAPVLLATPPATLLPLLNCPAGELHTQGIITAGGLIFCCIGNFFMFLSGANYALTMVRWGHRDVCWVLQSGLAQPCRAPTTRSPWCAGGNRGCLLMSYILAACSAQLQLRLDHGALGRGHASFQNPPAAPCVSCGAWLAAWDLQALSFAHVPHPAHLTRSILLTCRPCSPAATSCRAWLSRA